MFRMVFLVLTVVLLSGCGSTGASGQNGAKGTTGQNGLNGQDGANGASGQDGETGSTGASSLDGTDGEDGSNGEEGAVGSIGEIGQNGLNSLVDIEDISSGEACAYGGIIIHVGTDLNSNAILESNEINSSRTICAAEDIASQLQVQLGPIADASAKVYKIEDNGTKTLLYTQTTSSGSSFLDIGYIDSYSDEFEDDSFYLYEISGGEDVDADDNGLIDATATPNTGTIHLLVKGSDVKHTTQRIRITVLSEIMYVSVNSLLKNDLSSLQSALNTMAKSFFKADINGDGVINTMDVLNYNPVSDQASLKAQYSQSKLTAIIAKIHTNDLSYLVDIFDPTIAIYSPDSAEDTNSLVITSDKKIVYISSSNGLKKLDVSDLSNIIQIDTYNPIIKAKKLLLSSDESTLYAIVEKELYIIDTLTMESISTYTYTGANNQNIDFFVLSQDETILYLGSTYDTQIGVLNVSNSVTPTLIRNITGITKAGALALNSDSTHLFVGDFDNGFFDFNVSNILTTDAVEVYTSGLLADVRNIILSHDDKYIYFVNRKTDRFIIYDLTTRSSVGSMYLKEANDMDLSTDGKYLFIVNGRNSVVKIDISDVENPTIISSFSSTYTQNVEIKKIGLNTDESVAYMATTNGLEILNMTTSPNSSIPISIDTTSDNNNLLILSEDENYAYIGHSDGLSIYDLNMSTYVYEMDSTSVYSIVLNEDANKIYTKEYARVTGYDISNKSAPSELTNNNTISGANGLSLSAYNKKIFSLDNSTNTLHVLSTGALNASNDASSEKITTSDAPYDVISDYNDTTIFVAQNNGLATYSYTNYSNMRADNFELLSENLNRIKLRKLQYNQDKELLFAGTISGLVVYDVSDKTAPSIVASYGSYAADIQMSQDKSKLYVQKGSKLSVLDISDVSNIHEVLVIYTPHQIRKVKESSDSKTLYILTPGSILKYDIGFLHDLRGEIAPLAQDLNITSTTRMADIILLGSDIDSDDADLSYIITKPAVIVGENSAMPTLTCTNAQCLLTPDLSPTGNRNFEYEFSYKVFDGKLYSNEATVRVHTAKYLGFDGIVDPISVESPSTSGVQSITFTNEDAEEYTVSTNSDLNDKLEILTEKISSTKVKVTVNILDTGSNINFDIIVTVHSNISDQHNNKTIPLHYDASPGAV